MIYDFDEIIDRRPTDCAKWNLYDADVIALWVADMDFRSPQTVIDALRCRVDHGIFGYGMEPPELRPLLQERPFSFASIMNEAAPFRAALHISVPGLSAELRQDFGSDRLRHFFVMVKINHVGSAAL